MAMRALLAATLAALLLSGCIGGNSIRIAGQGFHQGEQSRTLGCGTTAQLAFGIQGAGSIQVRVVDGGGAEVFEQSVGMGQDGGMQQITGKQGTWRLVVSTGFGYGGQYAISLTC